MIHNVCLDLHCLLNEVNDHNRCIKYWLKNDMICIGLVSLFLVFVVESKTWLDKICMFFEMFALRVFVMVSFIISSSLYLRIRPTSKLLYSLQKEPQEEKYTSRRSASLLIRRKGQPYPANVTKTKFQVLRVVHRMTSLFLRIGFTEGDGGCFSSISAAF